MTTRRRQYRIESRADTVEPFEVRAASLEHAAQIAARRLNGRKRGLHAIRVTGDPGMSGYWQAYVPVKHGGASSWGRNFHVREA
jgi:hypothetical protein